MAIYECKPELASISVLLEIQRKGGGKVRTLNFDSTTGEWVGSFARKGFFVKRDDIRSYNVRTSMTVEDAKSRMTDRQLDWICDK